MTLSIPQKLAAFAAVLAALFGVGVAAGAVIDPDRGEPVAAAGPGGHGAMPGSAAPRAVRGLAVAQDGLRLVLDTPELRRGRPGTLRFHVVDRRGEVVRDFEVEHEKRMHLIVARRDLTGFQHLHPEQGTDGGWSARARLDEAGSYRVFADFARGGRAFTLVADLRVDGAADLRPLPAPAATTVTGTGYRVTLAGAPRQPGREAELAFTVSRDGRPVQTEPYLGAGGHLVALREGDLAFLHVHPEDDGVRFAATFPTAGRYRLFLQFKHAGRVHTAAFTREVG